MTAREALVAVRGRFSFRAPVDVAELVPVRDAVREACPGALVEVVVDRGRTVRATVWDGPVADRCAAAEVTWDVLP